MKKPMIDECPCCGLANDGGANVEALCEDMMRIEGGDLVDCTLRWRCRQCGCTWTHGQYEKAENRPHGATHAMRAVGRVPLSDCTKCVHEGDCEWPEAACNYQTKPFAPSNGEVTAYMALRVTNIETATPDLIAAHTVLVEGAG